METQLPTTKDIVVRYTLSKSSEIALNCDHWTSTDFAGAIDSGLLEYEDWHLKNEGAAAYEPKENAITVLITVNVDNNKNFLGKDDINPGLVDAFENNACSVAVTDDHTVYVAIKGTITEGHIHENPAS